jgi:ribosomal protein S12 methylthiotransferase accessory factor
LTRAQARVSALMEALEGFHAEEIAQPSVRETVGNMRRRLAYDPYTLPLNRPSLLSDKLPLDWVPATDLCTGAPSWVPRQLCELNSCVAERVYLPMFRASSSGLSTGNTPAEALVHGLCEVIERDACGRHPSARLDPERRVAKHTVSPRLGQRLLDHLSRAGMDSQIVDLSGPIGLPCFEVWVDYADGPALTEGSGCHPSRLTALIRALTEAAQSRLTYIAGSRDDIPRHIYRDALSPPSTGSLRLVSADAGRPYNNAPTLPAAGFLAQVRDIVGRVRSFTGMSPVAVDLTRPDFGIPAVFVVAPGLRLPKSL